MGAGTCREDAGLDVPRLNQPLGPVQREAFADAAQVDFAARFVALNCRPVRGDDELSGQLRGWLVQFVLPVLDQLPQRNIKQATGLLVGLQPFQQAIMAEFTDKQILSGLHPVDLPHIAAVEVAAEFAF